ncbi:filamentous hemagglutinin N-terminal domain-containing protein [Leptolyngbya sp. FACHB-261]|uniref:two-partner secretion domain-containing protein n=1 Tax=Leptolyngbya sp. FACHB-261 TaxID=2692806 RepID=UPI001684EE20|nr:filamentous hemagglutinin N-terminal domain-containing protein [Leptolyngbya sp. FACHB-261]MBD2100844.1 filamentous hemagglutinin N-terminal domain-containing protein [Leptolyngbya sp. FACHB-261]
MAAHNGCKHGFRLSLASFLALTSGIVGVANSALAQVTADPSIGTSVRVNGTTYRITGGTTVGNRNLFHSFSRFDVPAGSIAYFQNASNIANILARVTGRTPSNIQGRIQSQGTANLFLINPAGIVFGAGAQLNIGGSFVATTANALGFPGGGEFSLTSPVDAASPLLSINPSAFLFSQIPAQPIRSVGATLSVSEGRSLLLLGGDIRLDNSILVAGSSEGGRIELGGVAGAGTVGLSATGNDLRLSFPDNLTRADVSLVNQSVLDVVAANGGSIAVDARNLNVSGGSRLVAGINTGQGSVNSQAGDIEIKVTDVLTVAGSGSEVGNFVYPNATGNSGDIKIAANAVSVTDRARLSASTFGQGSAGSVVINAQGAVSFNNGNASSSVEAGAKGEGADIRITADSVAVTDGAFLSAITRGTGRAGSVEIAAQGAATFNNGRAFSNVEAGGVGVGGDIRITAGSVAVTDGAQLNAVTRGTGRAGNVQIDAEGPVSFSGVGSNGVRSGAFGRLEAGGVGEGGDIRITADSVSVTDGARLSAETLSKGDAGSVEIAAQRAVTFDNGTASSNVEAGGVGEGGDIRITAGSVSVTGGSRLSAVTRGRGRAGNVEITAREAVSFSGVGSNGLRSAAGSSVEAGGVGVGGDIRITAGSVAVTDGAFLSAVTRGRGRAGNVVIGAQEAVSFSGVGSNGVISGAFSSVEEGGVGVGGDIRITADSVAVTDGAVLAARTRGRGKAGNVEIAAQGAVTFDNGRAFSNVEVGGVGVGGDIGITAGSVSVTDGAQLNAITRGRGRAGNVEIDAEGPVSFSGVGSNGRSSAAGSSVEAGGVGAGGNIRITAGSASVTDGAFLSAVTRGRGRAGSVVIDAEGAVSFSGVGSNGRRSAAGSSVEADGVGAGGNIRITASSVSVMDRAFLSARSSGAGNAGKILINARDILQMNNGNISTAAAVDEGGDIDITAGDILLRNDSNITTFVNSGPGGGGNITLNADSILAFDDSDIVALAQGGRGGNVILNTSAFFGFRYQPAPPGTDPFTLDRNGRVDINAAGRLASGSILLPDTNFLQNSLTQLPANLIDTSTLLANSCIAHSDQQSGQFTVTGAGGLPVLPNDLSSSTFETYTVPSSNNSLEINNRPWQVGDPIEEPDAAYHLSNGQVVLSRKCF